MSYGSCGLFHLSKCVAVSLQFSTKTVWAGGGVGNFHGIPHIHKPLSRRCDGAKVRVSDGFLIEGNDEKPSWSTGHEPAFVILPRT